MASSLSICEQRRKHTKCTLSFSECAPILPEAVFEACKLSQPSAEGETQLSDVVGVLVHTGYDLGAVRLSERVTTNRSEDIEHARELV